VISAALAMLGRRERAGMESKIANRNLAVSNFRGM